jgi:hypothetical protein
LAGAVPAAGERNGSLARPIESASVPGSAD